MNASYILEMRTKPIIFDEFFSLGQEEQASPFLTPQSRKWAANLTLKASLLAAAFLLLAFILSFFPSLLPFSYILQLGVYFLAGIPSLIESVEDLLEFDVNIDVLMTLAAFSSVLIGSSLEGGLLLVLFALSGSIEDSVTAKAKSSLTHLNRLSPTKAWVLQQNGSLIERSVRDISVGTVILVKAGEIIPLDGHVIEGISSVNLVHLTGESLPVMKKVGDEVPSGARNLEGSLTVKVTHTSADSTVSRIIQLVTQAQEAKPQLQRWFDRLSRTYALSIISLSALFALTLPYVLGIPFSGLEGSVYRALAFLIAASPCALILALPIAYLSAVSACAKKGILLKGGVTLDALASCTAIAFDKTGTLTLGNLRCSSITALDKPSPWTEEELLAFAYTLEKNTVHPIAKAIVEAAEQKGLQSLPLKDFRSIPGYGLQGTILYKDLYLQAFMGSPSYILSQLPSSLKNVLEQELENIRAQGHTVAILLINQSPIIFTFQDTIRPGVQETLNRLQEKQAWDVVMLTGDHEASAKRVANQLGISSYYADLRPENKLEYVEKWARQKGLAMVGDGINDAPALARATVGICMGKVGSGTAVDAADVVLLQDNLERLDWLMNKAKTTQRIVRENLIIASAAICIASLPALAGLVPLWLAVVMHEGGTVLVGLNALRLLRS